MKNYILVFMLAIAGDFYCLAQVPTNYNADNESFGMQPMLQYAFLQLSTKPVKGLEESNVIGSRYLSEAFVKTGIYSEGGFEGYTYSRYDGYNEEVQLKKNLSDSEVSILLRRADIYCVVDNTTIVFKKFYGKKGNVQHGHLFKLTETENLTLFERKLKKYKDGKEAINSFQMSVKNRFVEDSELYYLKNGEEQIRFLKSTKKEIIGLFKEKPKKANAIKDYISKYNINLKGIDEIVKIFNYYETL